MFNGDTAYITQLKQQKIKKSAITFAARRHNVNVLTGGRPSTSVNGDIAIQWEWSNFDPSQNQPPPNRLR